MAAGAAHCQHGGFDQVDMEGQRLFEDKDPDQTGPKEVDSEPYNSSKEIEDEKTPEKIGNNHCMEMPGIESMTEQKHFDQGGFTTGTMSKEVEDADHTVNNQPLKIDKKAAKAAHEETGFPDDTFDQDNSKNGAKYQKIDGSYHTTKTDSLHESKNSTSEKSFVVLEGAQDDTVHDVLDQKSAQSSENSIDKTSEEISQQVVDDAISNNIQARKSEVRPKTITEPGNDTSKTTDYDFGQEGSNGSVGSMQGKDPAYSTTNRFLKTEDPSCKESFDNLPILEDQNVKSSNGCLDASTSYEGFDLLDISHLFNTHSKSKEGSNNESDNSFVEILGKTDQKTNDGLSNQSQTVEPGERLHSIGNSDVDERPLGKMAAGAAHCQHGGFDQSEESEGDDQAKVAEKKQTQPGGEKPFLKSTSQKPTVQYFDVTSESSLESESEDEESHAPSKAPSADMPDLNEIKKLAAQFDYNPSDSSDSSESDGEQSHAHMAQGFVQYNAGESKFLGDAVLSEKEHHREMMELDAQIQQSIGTPSVSQHTLQTQAATKIQAHYRGMQSRLQVASIKHTIQIQSATKIQACYRGVLSRFRARAIQVQAVTKIQACHRGAISRAHTTYIEAVKNAAAILIQAHYRGHRTAIYLTSEEFLNCKKYGGTPQQVAESDCLLDPDIYLHMFSPATLPVHSQLVEKPTTNAVKPVVESLLDLGDVQPPIYESAFSILLGMIEEQPPKGFLPLTELPQQAKVAVVDSGPNNVALHESGPPSLPHDLPDLIFGANKHISAPESIEDSLPVFPMIRKKAPPHRPARNAFLGSLEEQMNADAFKNSRLIHRWQANSTLQRRVVKVKNTLKESISFNNDVPFNDAPSCLLFDRDATKGFCLKEMTMFPPRSEISVPLAIFTRQQRKSLSAIAERRPSTLQRQRKYSHPDYQVRPRRTPTSNGRDATYWKDDSVKGHDGRTTPKQQSWVRGPMRESGTITDHSRFLQQNQDLQSNEMLPAVDFKKRGSQQARQMFNQQRRYYQPSRVQTRGKQRSKSAGMLRGSKSTGVLRKTNISSARDTNQNCEAFVDIRNRPRSTSHRVLMSTPSSEHQHSSRKEWSNDYIHLHKTPEGKSRDARLRQRAKAELSYRSRLEKTCWGDENRIQDPKEGFSSEAFDARLESDELKLNDDFTIATPGNIASNIKMLLTLTEAKKRANHAENITNRRKSSAHLPLTRNTSITNHRMLELSTRKDSGILKKDEALFLSSTPYHAHINIHKTHTN